LTADGRFFLVTAAHLFEGCDPGRFAIASANTTQMWSIGRCNLLIPTDETSASSPCARFVLPLRRRGHPNHWDGDCHTEPQWMQWCVHLGVREPPQGVSFWTPEHCLRVVGVQCASLKGRYFRAKSWGAVLAIMRQTPCGPCEWAQGCDRELPHARRVLWRWRGEDEDGISVETD